MSVITLPFVLYIIRLSLLIILFVVITLAQLLGFLQINTAGALIAIKVKNPKPLPVLHKVLINFDFEYYYNFNIVRKSDWYYNCFFFT